MMRFTKTHEWVKVDGGKATAGITAHAQEEISDVVFVELPKPGKKVAQGEEVAVVESVKAAFSIYAPLSGRVAQVNGSLTQDPGTVNRSPTDEGWIFVLEDINPSEAQGLMDQTQYEEWVKGGH